MSEGTKVSLLLGDGTVAVYEGVDNWHSEGGEIVIEAADGSIITSNCKYIVEEPPDNAGTTS